MAASDGLPVPPLDDDVVIDLRDGVIDPVPPSHEEKLVDLREPPVRPPSGRPADLLPGHRVITITGGDLWMQAEAFVYDIYRSVGFCEESPRRQVEELARWSDASTFHAVVTDDDEIIGTIRTIIGDYAELPIAKFRRVDHRHGDPVCELSSLTVRQDVRSTGVIEHLYRAGWLAAFRSVGTNAAVALIDDWLLEVFVATYHLPFVIIGEPQPYMGGDPIPVALSLDGAAYDSMAASNPDFWRWTLEALTPEEARAWGLPTTLGDGSVVVPGAALHGAAR
jgi:hypothetical protein